MAYNAEHEQAITGHERQTVMCSVSRNMETQTHLRECQHRKVPETCASTPAANTKHLALVEIEMKTIEAACDNPIQAACGHTFNVPVY